MKYISFIFVFIGVSICVLTSCVGEWKSEYEQHFSSIHTFHTSSISESGDGTYSVSGVLDLYGFPDEGGESVVIDRINNAQEKIWITVYIWTNKNIANAVIDAKNRGVDVRIIVEPNVYKTPTINRSLVSYFQKRGIDVVYSDNDRYKFTHAKYALIDNSFFISTGNLTLSLFKNREYMIFGTDPTIHTFLTAVFLADYEHKNLSENTIFPETVILAPINARERIKNLFTHTSSKIQLYTQYISDRELLSTLVMLKKNNPKIEVSVCVSNTESNRELVDQYADFDWKIAENPYLHAKIMIFDGNIVFLGSQNLSQNALDNNREVSMIFANRQDIITHLQNDIASHCKSIENK